MGIFTEYVNEAMRRAEYKLIEDEEPFFGFVPDLPGAWASGKTLKACQEELQSVVEEWLLLGIRKGHTIPKLGDLDLNVGAVAIEAN